MSFLDEIDEKRAAEIRKLKPKKGMWAQMSSEFGDVWHEIESVYLCKKDKHFSKDYSSLSLYCHRKNERPVEMHYFWKIRTVVSKLPKDARIILCKEGMFSPRNENLDKLPKRLKK